MILIQGGPAAGQDDSTPPQPPQSQEESRAEAHASLDSLDQALQRTPDRIALRLERLRTLYFLSVEEEERIKEAEIEIGRIRELADHHGQPQAAWVAGGYTAALDVVRGKHAFWPGSKWGHVQDGLAVLDTLVSAHPDEPEIRYLRLASCFYLPFFFRRGGSVEDDLAHLVTLLPDSSGLLSQAAFDRVRDFVIEEATLTPEQRSALERGAGMRVVDDPPPQ